MNYQKNYNKDCKTTITINRKWQSIKTTIRNTPDATLSKGKIELKKYWVNTKVMYSIKE